MDDVDLGAATGFQFAQSGGVLSLGMRMRVSPAEYLYGFQIEVGPFEADGDTGRPKYLTSDTAAGAAFAHAPAGNRFGTPATYVLNNPPGLASVGASDIASSASGLVDLGTLTLGVVGSAVVEITGRIVAASFSSGRALPGKPPIIAGTGYAALSTGRRRRQLGGAEALASAMPPNALARRKRAIEASEAEAAAGVAPTSTTSPPRAGQARRLGEAGGGACASSCEVWGDFDGDCEFNINDVTQLSLLQQRRSAYERAAQAGTAAGVVDPLMQLCPWQQMQANPNRDYLPNGALNSDGNDAQWLLYAVFKYYRFLTSVQTSCVLHEGDSEAAAQI